VKLDEHTEKLTRVRDAKICVEMDLNEPLAPAVLLKEKRDNLYLSNPCNLCYISKKRALPLDNSNGTKSIQTKLGRVNKWRES